MSLLDEALLDEIFEELLAKLREPNALNPVGSDPIFYFVYPPSRMLDLKQRLSRWTAKVREAGFEVERVSLSDLLWKIVDESGRWDLWLEYEPEHDVEQMNDAIRDVLQSDNRLIEEVSRRVTTAQGNKIIFVTEAEMLHPFFRTRVIENWLHDRVKVPVVIFYPGRRSGQYGLHFLDFYPEDPNYRSTIVGGFNA